MLTKLGPFQILEVIGRGGMGTVYRGIDPIIGRPVAVKVIRLLGYNDSDEQAWLKDRLFREARAAGSLCHPGIVTIYQVGEYQDVAYIAMEFVDGPSLQDILAREEPEDKAMLCRILCETAAALDYAHKRGLVHRDIKPANIMVTTAGTTKVTDFGIAKTMLGQTATKTGMILGTPFYMSPEQIRGKALDGRSDQFALAVVAYEMFTGRKPFQAEHLTSICYQIIHEEALSAEDVNPGVGGEVAAVLKRGLAKDADARYSTCTGFAEALLAAFRMVPEARQTPAPEADAPPPTDSPLKSVSRSRLLPVAPEATQMSVKPLLGGVVAIAAAIAGIWVIRISTSPAEIRRSVLIDPPSAALVVSQPQKIAPALKPQSAAGGRRPPVARVDVESKPREIESVGRAASKPLEQYTAPAPEGKGPSAMKGMLVWTGHIAKGELLTIAGARASTGSLSGTLPGTPVTVQVYPAEAGNAGLTVFTSDSRYVSPTWATTPRGSATFTFDPRHATDIVVFEAPGPQNNWERLVIRVNNLKMSACVIEWNAEQ